MEHSFKPYYNWNTFNTEDNGAFWRLMNEVLNLIITGIPSILMTRADDSHAPLVF